MGIRLGQGHLLKSFAAHQPSLRFLLAKLNNLRCELWDRVHRVDTCGQIPLSTFSFEGRNKHEGLEYFSQHPRITRAALRSLPVAHERYTFVDLGCGKGRVLLLAAALPFRKIVGVEFAPPLAEIARRNIASFRWGARRCREMEVITADATEYELPAEPLVVFFANPFFPAVMQEVLGNIENSLRRHPRELMILYAGLVSRRESAFAGHAEYERLRRERYFDLYRRRESVAGEHPVAA